MKAVPEKLIVWTVSILSVLSLIVSASPISLRLNSHDSDELPVKAGIDKLPADKCPQIVRVNNGEFSASNLLKQCRAGSSLLDIFNKPENEFLEITSRAPLLTLVCNGLVALVRDVAQKQEITSVCKDNALGDMEVDFCQTFFPNGSPSKVMQAFVEQLSKEFFPPASLTALMKLTTVGKDCTMVCSGEGGFFCTALYAYGNAVLESRTKDSSEANQERERPGEEIKDSEDQSELENTTLPHKSHVADSPVSVNNRAKGRYFNAQQHRQPGSIGVDYDKSSNYRRTQQNQGIVGLPTPPLPLGGRQQGGYPRTSNQGSSNLPSNIGNAPSQEFLTSSQVEQGQNSPADIGQNAPLGRTGVNTPLGSNGQNVPLGRTGVNTPLGSNGQNVPLGRTGVNTPLGSNGRNAPLGRNGENAPFRGTGENAPFRGTGGNAPLGGTGQNVPLGRTGQNVPLGRTGQNVPLGRTGQNAPLGRNGENAPLGSNGRNAPLGRNGENAPFRGTGGNVPLGGTGENVPLGRTGQNVPLGRTGQNVPLGGTGQNVPLGRNGENAPLGRNGENAPLGRTGGNAPLGGTGENVPLGRTGGNAPLGGIGENVPLGRNGENAPLGRTGGNAPLSRTGGNTPLGKTGEIAPLGETGQDGQNDDMQKTDGENIDSKLTKTDQDTDGEKDTKTDLDADGDKDLKITKTDLETEGEKELKPDLETDGEKDLKPDLETDGEKDLKPDEEDDLKNDDLKLTKTSENVPEDSDVMDGGKKTEDNDPLGESPDFPKTTKPPEIWKAQDQPAGLTKNNHKDANKLEVEVTEEEYSGYSTYHFFTLFILTVAVAIACYFGLANRKRLRDNVSGLLSSRGRKRRMRDYRPLGGQ